LFLLVFFQTSYQTTPKLQFIYKNLAQPLLQIKDVFLTSRKTHKNFLFLNKYKNKTDVFYKLLRNSLIEKQAALRIVENLFHTSRVFIKKFHKFYLRLTFFYGLLASSILRTLFYRTKKFR